MRIFKTGLLDLNDMAFYVRPLLDGDGGDGGGSDSGDSGDNGSDGASDEGSKGVDEGEGEGKKSDPTHDEASGKSYFELHKELTEKYGKVDLEKYAKVEGIDPTEYADLKALAEQLEADPALYEDIKKILADFKAGTYKPKSAANRDPLVAKLAKALAGFKGDKLKEKQAAQKERETQLVKEFDREVDGAIASAMKTAKMEKLLPKELQSVKAHVEAAFIKDAESKKPALTYKDLPKLIETAFKTVENDRREILALSVRRDDAPGNGSGAGGGDFRQKAPTSKRERLAAITRDAQAIFNK